MLSNDVADVITCLPSKCLFTLAFISCDRAGRVASRSDTENAVRYDWPRADLDPARETLY